jgi:hypothetical protein
VRRSLRARHWALVAVLMAMGCAPRPARTICSAVGKTFICTSAGPDRCHPDHPTYQQDVASGVCQ